MKGIITKTIYILFIFFFTRCEKCIFIGDVTFSTQHEIDEFAKQGYSRVTGSVTIQGDYIENLDGLSKLNTIEMDLKISHNKSLLEIGKGLNNLSYVGKSVTIFENRNLTKIDGLNNLVSVKRLYIVQNYNLVDISGFSNLAKVEEGFSLGTNNKLVNLDGFKNLSEIIGSLEIAQNGGLINVDGFANLKYVGEEMTLARNRGLTNIDGFSNLNFVGARIQIDGNSVLRDFCGLQPLLLNGILGGSLSISSNFYNPNATQIINANCSK